MELNHLQQPNVINIFTDGSIVGLHNETIGCAGAVLCTGNLVKEKRGDIYQDVIVRNATNSITELEAIRLGINLLNRVEITSNTIINLFSDSQTCINTIRNWIFTWIKTLDGGVMYNSTGPVKNQDYISMLLNTIIVTGYHINFYHQKGHVNKSPASLANAQRVFYNSNKEVATLDLINFISYYNNMVDIRTKDTLKDFIAENNHLVPPLPIACGSPIDFFEIQKYYKLVNRRK